MAFKLTKTQVKELTDRRAQLAKLRTLAVQEFDTLSAAIDGIVAPLNDLIRRYNDALAEVRALAQAVVDEHRDTFDDKSDAWKEGDRGLAASDFIDAWENVSLDDVAEVELIIPDAPEFDTDALDDLPEEADA